MLILIIYIMIFKTYKPVFMFMSDKLMHPWKAA